MAAKIDWELKNASCVQRSEPEIEYKYIHYYKSECGKTATLKSSVKCPPPPTITLNQITYYLEGGVERGR